MKKNSIITRWEFRFVAHAADEIPNIEKMRLGVFQHLIELMDGNITKWEPTIEESFRICGNIENDTRFDNGKCIITSEVAVIHRHDNILHVTTDSGSKYHLSLDNLSPEMSSQVEEYRNSGLVSDQVGIIFMQLNCFYNP